jgi:hypothetical protein
MANAGGVPSSFESTATNESSEKSDCTDATRVSLHSETTKNESIHPGVPSATARIRRLRGGSQAQLLLCTDGYCYVVKFQNNPQGARSLVSDMLGTLLAAELGLPTQPSVVVHVHELFVHDASDMFVQRPHGATPYQSGLCFGSRYPCEVGRHGRTRLAMVAGDWPAHRMKEIANLADFAGMLVFDQWTCNTDERQVIFWKATNGLRYQASMIDQGHCFNGAAWNFPDLALWGLYRKPEVYAGVRTFEAFEPWLDALERRVTEKALLAAAEKIPPIWYGGDTSSLHNLLEELDARRRAMRETMWLAVQCSHHWFPAFTDH